MSKEIRFKCIALSNGQDAVLSTVELKPGLYETIMASPDYSFVYTQLRTTDKAQAIADFKHLLKTYHISPLTGKYADLATDLEAAAAYGLEIAANVEDGGTCNFDAVALDLRGWKRDKVEQAAKAAGVGCSTWTLFGSKKYVFSIRSRYQGNARTKAAEAMMEALKLSGYDARMYYQAD